MQPLSLVTSVYCPRGREIKRFRHSWVQFSSSCLYGMVHDANDGYMVSRGSHETVRSIPRPNEPTTQRSDAEESASHRYSIMLARREPSSEPDDSLDTRLFVLFCHVITISLLDHSYLPCWRWLCYCWISVARCRCWLLVVWSCAGRYYDRLWMIPAKFGSQHQSQRENRVDPSPQVESFVNLIDSVPISIANSMRGTNPEKYLS